MGWITPSSFSIGRRHEPSRLFDGTGEELFTTKETLSGTTPDSIFCWVHSFNPAANDAVWELGNGGSNNIRFCYHLAGGTVRYRIRTTVEADATTTNELVSGKWNSIAVVTVSDTSRLIVLNADFASKGSSSGTRVVSAGQTQIGNGGFSPWDGRVSWWCAWGGYALTDDDITRLHRGLPPWEIRPQFITSMPNMRTLYDPFLRVRWAPSGTRLAPPYKLWAPRIHKPRFAPAVEAGVGMLPMMMAHEGG